MDTPFELDEDMGKMLNDLGGDVTVIHLPEVGLRGNNAFPYVGFKII